MKRDAKDDDLEKDFEGLDLFEPSMRFSKNVMEQIKEETKLVRPERGALYWLPRVFGFSTLGVFMLLIVLLVVEQENLSAVTVSRQVNQLVMTLLGTVGGLMLFLGTDRLFKKWMLG